MNYEMLKKQANLGWNTWNTMNVLSHVRLPEGFAINLCIKDFSRGDVLRQSLIGRGGENDEHIHPGSRTFGGGYTELNMRYGPNEYEIRTAVRNDEQYILITPLKRGVRPSALIVEACLLWGKPGSVTKYPDGTVGGVCGGREFRVYTTGKPFDLQHTQSLSPYFSVLLESPVVVSTKPCAIAEAESILAEAKAALDGKYENFGKHAEAYRAMNTVLAWDTIYEAEHDRVVSPVSRLWNMGWGGYVLFDWDTYFAALMSSYDNRELAWLNAVGITDEVTERGFIPNFGAAHNDKSRDRSQPPVGSHVCLEIYKRWPEKWFLERVYPVLSRWNEWFFAHRNIRDGYMGWGSDPYEPVNGKYREMNATNCTYGGALESGLDNSPMYDGMPFDTDRHLMLLADVGLMGLYIMDCRALAEMARILGREEDAPAYEERLRTVDKALMTMWSDKKGIFLNKRMDSGELSERVSPTNFYALHSDSVTEEQKRRMMDEHFYNPDEFYGEWMLATIAKNDPAFPDQNYWRGRIWAPTNYLAYIAMKHAGLKKECAVLAEKSENLLLREWTEHGHVHENYSGIDGTGCGVGNSDAFYHWGALLSYIALDADGQAPA